VRDYDTITVSNLGPTGRLIATERSGGGVEVFVFVVAAAVAGGLAMGGVTLVYFLDKWREDHEGRDAVAPVEETTARLDRAA
jgi:hypothetical protein